MTPLIYLPSLPVTAASYTPLFDSFQGLSVDYPGFAGQPEDPTLTTIADYAARVLAAMDQAQIRQAALIGTSFGGQLALYLAAHHPDRVTHLAINSTFGLPIQPEEQAMFSGLAQAAGDQGAAALADTLGELLLSATTRQTQPAIGQQLRDMMFSASPQALRQTFTALANRPDPTPWLAAIKAPTLITWGADEIAVPAAQRDALAKISQAQVVTISRSAHFPYLENTREFLPVLQRFMAS